MYRLTSLCLGLCLCAVVYAGTQTQLIMQKITVLSGADAQGFQKVFGASFDASPALKFNCKANQCQIQAQQWGFRGDIPTKLLGKRQAATFSSEDKHFILHCGTTTVHFCNLSQRDAVLA